MHSWKCYNNRLGQHNQIVHTKIVDYCPLLISHVKMEEGPKLNFSYLYSLFLIIKKSYISPLRPWNTVTQSMEDNSGPPIWFTDHNTDARPGYTIHIRPQPSVCGWCPEYMMSRIDRTTMRLFNKNHICRHVRSLHGSTGNVGSSMSAQPLLPTDSDLGE